MTTPHDATPSVPELGASSSWRTFALSASAFALLCGYYMLKTLREPLLLATGGAELKAYAGAAQALALLFAVPAYAWVTARVTRPRLVFGAAAIFAASLVAVAAPADAALRSSTLLSDRDQIRWQDFFGLGYVFFVWIGVFAVALIAQFWSLATEVYSTTSGRTAFPWIGLGATLGAIVGARATHLLGLDGTAGALIPAAALFVCHGALALWGARQSGREAALRKPLLPSRGFDRVFEDGYVRSIAAVAVTLSLVNALGEFVLSQVALSKADAAVAAGTATDIATFLHAYYGDFFFRVNVVTALVQGLAVGVLLRVGGVALCLFVPVIVSAGAYAALALGGSLALFRVLKIAENAVDYSVMNTAKGLVWIPTTSEQKYQAKQAVDTFFVRLGDFAQAGIVFVGVHVASLETRGFAALCVVLIAGWGALTWRLAVRHRAATTRIALTTPPAGSDAAAQPA